MSKTITDWEQVPNLLSAQDVADLLGKSYATARRYMKDGTLPTESIGSVQYVSKHYLMERFGVESLHMRPQMDPQVIHHLERAQYHHNQAMRLLEVP